MTASARASGRAAPPVRLVHLGLGNFFRAHAAAYTQDLPCPDPSRPDWGFAAFGGRVPGAGAATEGSGPGSSVVDTLAAQGVRYTLLKRGPDVDRAAVVMSVPEVYPASDARAWLALVASPDVVAVTLTVSEDD